MGKQERKNQEKMVRQTERPVEQEPVPAEFVLVTIRVLKCPCCKKGMSPRVIKTDGNRKRLRCGRNGCEFTAIYNPGETEPTYVRGWVRTQACV